MANVQSIEKTHELFLEASEKSYFIKPETNITCDIKKSTINIILGNNESTYQDQVLINDLTHVTEE